MSDLMELKEMLYGRISKFNSHLKSIKFISLRFSRTNVEVSFHKPQNDACTNPVKWKIFCCFTSSFRRLSKVFTARLLESFKSLRHFSVETFCFQTCLLGVDFIQCHVVWFNQWKSNSAGKKAFGIEKRENKSFWLLKVRTSACHY